MKGVRAFVVLITLSALSVAAGADTVVWRKTPIAVDLVVGVEQMIILPQDGAVGLPPALSNPNLFRTLVTGGTAYWTALEPFDSQRVKVRLDSGEYILFDVSAYTEKSPPAATGALQVVISSESDAGGHGAAHSASDDQSPATLF